MKRSPAFTLIELLVVITLIAVLAGLILTAVANVRKVSEREAGANQLRQVGIALGAYVSDNNGFLPGPMWPGQIPVYDPGEQGVGRLANHLAPYLDIDDPSDGDDIHVLIPPAFRKWRDATPPMDEPPRSYVLNFFVETNGEIVNPWGRLVPTPTAPKLAATVPANTWAVSDADQQHPRVVAAPWRAFTPEEIIHGKNRLALTFSGSVQRVETEDLAVPTP